MHLACCVVAGAALAVWAESAVAATTLAAGLALLEGLGSGVCPVTVLPGQVFGALAQGGTPELSLLAASILSAAYALLLVYLAGRRLQRMDVLT